MLPAEQRGDIEVAMSRELVVVHYDCRELTVLPDCTLQGKYGYVGITPREQVISIANPEELRLNFPLNDGQLEHELQTGTHLEFASAIVGQAATIKRTATRDELKGNCTNATHFVRSATLGAFAVALNKGATRSAEEVFLSDANPGATATKIVSRDGTLQACRTADPAQSNKVPGCTAPLKLELAPLANANTAISIADEAPASCPTGTRESDAGKCVAVHDPHPYVCSFAEHADCERQCKLGSAGSCALAARNYQLGRGVKADPEAALDLYVAACNGGSPPGCGRLGEVLVGNPKHRENGLELLHRSCRAGFMPACKDLGSTVASDRTSTENPVLAAQRGCDGGDAVSCWLAGALLQEFAKDTAAAQRYYRLACEGDAPRGCVSYSDLIDPGDTPTPETPHALDLLTRACERALAASCDQLARYYFLGKGVPLDSTKGVALLERACAGHNRGSCMIAGMRYEKGIGAPRDVAKAFALYNQDCEAGRDDACKQAERLRKTGSVDVK
jgi:TPR repeat protein